MSRKDDTPHVKCQTHRDKDLEESPRRYEVVGVGSDVVSRMDSLPSLQDTCRMRIGFRRRSIMPRNNGRRGTALHLPRNSWYVKTATISGQ